MKPSSDLTAMYRSFPVYLWVEDEETRAYLQTAWNHDPLIGIYVAGGVKHLTAVVGAAHRDVFPNVFGYRDRDFTRSNLPRWRDAAETVLVGEVFEVENLLLDAEALAECEVNTSGQTADRIEQAMSELASPLVWWMSCRKTITDIRDAAEKDFIGHPSRTKVQSMQEAMDAIVGSAWWTTALPALHPAWGDRLRVQSALDRHEVSHRAMLHDGRWRREFSGKEILAELRSRIWTRKQLSDPQGRVQLVRAVAESQRRLGRVPAEITALRTALHERIGR